MIHQNTLPHLRFLIADDVTETRRSTRLMLSLLPEAEIVAIAKNGREAVELARQHKPDIALIDVNMPQMNGIQAIRIMVEENPLLVCIVLSAERDTQTLVDAIAAGARGYLTKPFTVDQLTATIQQTWNHSVAQIRAAIASVSKATAVAANPVTNHETAQLRQQRDYFLTELANEYLRTRRTDEKAMQVLEILAQDPQCEPRLLTALAMIYALNQRWAKLKLLASRLEQMT